MRVTRGIEKIVPYQPGKPLGEVEREFGISDLTKMASNENPFGPSPKAVEAMARALKTVHLYPDGDCYALKEKLSGRLGVSRDEIIVGNGSNEVIDLVIRTFMTSADTGLTGEAAFLVFKLHTLAIDATIVEVPLRDYRFDLKAMRERIDDRVRLVFIPNPNNPTGTYVTADELEAFLDATSGRDLLVILDEAYCEFVSAADYPDGLKLYRRYPHLVLTRSFSKSHGLAGARIGYGVARPEVAAYCNKVREPFNVNSVAQAGALAALDDTEHVEMTIRKNREGLRWLTEQLTEMGLAVVPSVTNFLLVDMKREAAPLFQQLLREGVIVRPTTALGYPNHLRISVGTREDNERLVRTLKKVM